MSKSQFLTVIQNSDFIVRDHRVHGVRVMPGVTFIDVVYRILISQGIPIDQIVLRNILFSEPIATAEDFDRQIRLTLDERRGVNTLLAESRRSKDDTPLEAGWTENFRCEWARESGFPAKSIDIAGVIRAARQRQDVDSIYEKARSLGIHHYEFMKGLGTIHWGEDDMLSEIRLGSLASAYADNFCLHPVFLDCSTLFPFSFNMMESQGELPYIPLFIASFRARATLKDRAFVYVRRNRDAGKAADVIKTSYEVYDESGQAVILFGDFTAKQIRSKDLIEKLVGAHVRPAADPAAAAAAGGAPGAAPAEATRQERIAADVQRLVAELTGRTPDEISVTAGFYDQGLESSNLIDLVHRLEQKLGRQFYPTLLFEYTDIMALAGYLDKECAEAYPLDAPSPAAITPQAAGQTPAGPGPAAAAQASPAVDGAAVEEDLLQLLATVSGRPAADFDAAEGFYDQGLESSQLMQLVRLLEEKLGRQLYPTLLFEYTTVRDLAGYLLGETAGAYPLAGAAARPAAAVDGLVAIHPVRIAREIEPAARRRAAGRMAVVDPSGKWAGVLAQSPSFLGCEIRGITPETPPSEWLAEGTLPDRILFMAPELGAAESFGAILSLYREWMKRFAKQPVALVAAYPAPSAELIGQRALGGLLRSLSLENTHWRTKTVGLAFPGRDTELFAARLADELFSDENPAGEVLYAGSGRFAGAYREFALPAADAGPIWRQDGVYLVLGGGGYLGNLVADHIAGRSGAAVVAVGRSARAKSGPSRSTVSYRSCDLADAQAVRDLVLDLRRRHGRINGVVQAAGVLKDGLAHRKTPADAAAVFQPKIDGTLALDQALADEPLDFFLLFSSTTGLFGNAGQSDYAFANAFLDEFAAYRNDMAARGARQGRTISVNWPLWEQGGMGVGESVLAWARQNYGIAPLPAAAGLDCLDRILATGAGQAGVFYGEPERIRRSFALLADDGTIPEPSGRPAARPVPETGRAAAERPAGDDIAIVGVSARFPLAADLEEFWTNLVQGRDCISEIPADRWDHDRIYDADRGKIGTSYGKWGGFIDGVDKFDPLFFNISPREAEMLDPQERLFLETAWNTLEDGGYTRTKLAKEVVGVFAGVMWGQYQLFERQYQDRTITPGSFYAAVVNRVSYFFDFKGPSLAVDTMCSSSLTAMYLACQAIEKGDCTMALAGGVNLSLHPNKYVQLSQAQFFSSDGRCRAFGAGGDGYVPGEGVGAVLLKSLARARADGDRIHAVIKAGALNHGGKTSGFSVPHPVSQALVIEKALERSGWEPGSLSYLEAHGTGTSLGDPIEISGLARALEKSGKLPPASLPIGSVKSNIGHLEAAAGMASVAKVILQMRYRTLVPSLHSRVLNPGIPFDQTPFYVPQAATPWRGAAAGPSEGSARHPLRAGISAFGAGGSNAHLLLEEYPQDRVRLPAAGLNLFVLSARDEDRLVEYARRMVVFLDRPALADGGEQEPGLQELCFTAQTGREAFEERLGLLAATVGELRSGLVAFIEGTPDAARVFRGSAGTARKSRTVLAAKAGCDLAALAAEWVRGGEVDWCGLYPTRPSLCALPHYPLYRERCWVCEDGWLSDARPGARGSVPGLTALHSLLDANTSDFHSQSYRKTLGLEDRLIADHRVLGQTIFPGSAYVEMARAAVVAAGGAAPMEIRDILWLNPVVVGRAGTSVTLRLQPADTGLEYRLVSGGPDHETIHGTGRIGLDPAEPVPASLDLPAIRGRCTQVKQGDEIYAMLAGVGFAYGPSYRVTRSIHCAETESLAHLALPEVHPDPADMALHPALLDGVFRSTLGIQKIWAGDAPRLYVPFAVERLFYWRALGGECLAHARLRDTAGQGAVENLQYDIDVVDPAGGLLARIEGFTVRPFEPVPAARRIASATELNYFRPRQIAVGLEPQAAPPANLLVFAPDQAGLEALLGQIRQLPSAPRAWAVLPGKAFASRGADIWEHTGSAEDFAALAAALPLDGLDSLGVLQLWPWAAADGQAPADALGRGLYPLMGMVAAFAGAAPKLAIRCVLAYSAALPGADLAHYRAVQGFARSLSAVSPYFQLMGTEWDEAAWQAEDRLPRLLAELSRPGKVQGEWIGFRGTQRLASGLCRVEPGRDAGGQPPLTLRKGAVYLIVGGAGGLGALFARLLSREHGACLVLSGRSPLDEAIQAKLREITDLGGQAEYLPCDITDGAAVEGLVQEIVRRHGGLAGVFHCAGHADTRPFNQVDRVEFDRSLGPKLRGTVNIERACRTVGLDFMVLFSSISSVMGDFGVGSYAVSNAFLDACALQREAERLQGSTAFPILSIAWPYWHEGGMAMDPDAEKMYFDYLGLKLLDAESGWAAFRQLLEHPAAFTVVLPGTPDKARRALGNAAAPGGGDGDAALADGAGAGADDGAAAPTASATDSMGAHALEEHLKAVFSRILKIPKGKLAAKDSFDKYGMDSVLLMEITQSLEKDFGPLPKTLLFEARSIRDLAATLQRTKAGAVADLLAPGAAAAGRTLPPPAKPRPLGRLLADRPAPGTSAGRPAAGQSEEPIAVIGLGGQFPQSESLEEFWQNLRAGRDCIVEIPPERWDYRETFDPRQGVPNKTYGKWGSFLDRPGAFDPLFFDIPPVMAKTINPQERLFLQTAWAAMEDAGYTKESLQEDAAGGRAARLGVFVGVMWNDYLLYGGSSDHSSIANRVSFVLNANGPSVAIDTACSSSLVAIHYACEHLRRDDCRYAIAGGVNLSMHASKYIGLGSIHALSPTGRCRAFGSGADGYVPGEGVGAVLLKRLGDAVRDKDHVYGVILGSAINHGGKTNGYTVPNPTAQKQVISEAWRRSGVHPRSISYIEAHGTGTSLGDPIEVAGLKGAFEEHTQDKEFCALGSVKSNIGHLEAASGIASLAKVLLQMRDQELVPSLHSGETNPLIDFTDSPMRVQRRLEPWAEPRVALDGQPRSLPRRAGISAFGAGGTNVHLVVEEFAGAPAAQASSGQDELFVLSARNRPRLVAYARKILAHLALLREANPGTFERLCLGDVAHTYRIGREAMEARLAFPARDLEDLEAKLRDFIQDPDTCGLHFGVADDDSRQPVLSMDSAEDAQYLASIAAKADWDKLARIWVGGAELDWSRLGMPERARRVSLPGYPFEAQDFWLAAPAALGRTARGAGEPIHPLLDSNQSTLQSQAYAKTFEGSEFCLRDHVIAGHPMLPGAAYVEMVLAAAHHATEGQSTGLENVFWAEPIIHAGAELPVNVSLVPDDAGLRFEVTTGQGGARRAHAAGRVSLTEPAGRPGGLDLAAIKRRCGESLQGPALYAALKQVGFGYGPSFQVIGDLHCGAEEALSAITFPAGLSPALGDCFLHPSILDGAFQTATGIRKLSEGRNGKLYVPVGVEKIEVFAPLASPCFAYAVLSGSASADEDLVKYDVLISDTQGEVAALVKHLTVRARHQPNGQPPAGEPAWFGTGWQDATLTGAGAGPSVTLVYDESGTGAGYLLQARILSAHPGARVMVAANRERFSQESAEAFGLNFRDEEQQRELLGRAGAGGQDRINIVFLGQPAAPFLESADPLDAADDGFLFALTRAMHRTAALGKVRLFHVLLDAADRLRSATAWGFANSVATALPGLQMSVVTLDPDARDGAAIADALMAELGQEEGVGGTWVLRQGGQRKLRRVLAAEAPRAATPLRRNGVYLITGGAGGLGAMTARHLAATHAAKVLLTGRSARTARIDQLLAELAAAGGEADYFQADAGDEGAMAAALGHAHRHFGPLNGIFHIAGHASEHPVTTSTRGDFRAVLGSKITGTVLLDRLTSGDSLDFLVLYSSLSALLGDFGSCNYAMGNSFLDAFVQTRADLVRQGLRSGATIAIDWPLWREGGMALPEEAGQVYFQTTGIRLLESAEGMQALEACLAAGESGQFILAQGDLARIRATFGKVGQPRAVPRAMVLEDAPEEATDEATEAPGQASLQSGTIHYLKTKLAAATQIPYEKIQAKAEFQKFGIDSIVIMELNRLLELDFAELPKTLFFEYKSIHELAGYFLANHREKMAALANAAAPGQAGSLPAPAVGGTGPAGRAATAGKALFQKRSLPQAVPALSSGPAAAASPDIAIIGMDGRYPMAPGLPEFWDNIRNGKDCIAEIPAGRWDYRIHYEAGKRKIGKIYAKWGGFLNGIDQFDPLFFRISPREADWTDPQERLFLQTAWRTIEDAGYTRDDMADQAVGVFVGVMWANYQLFGADLARDGKGIAPNCLYASIPNRVSHFFDFKGPSLAVDSMCSSSLLSIHLAADSIRKGECRMALAGGVNLCVHPNKYLQLSQGNFLSTDGRCRGFGEGGDGYVPGEGVGAVLLKDLQAAIRDGDNIYGVIKASAVNHGGRTNGFSVPNPAAQAEVIGEALRKAAIAPESVSYIEAHGTGTSLGDPIEMVGLERAFAQAGKAASGCAIGTVKSNIGHLEAAAGVAGVTKVLLQLKHGQLAPSIHAGELNRNIPFQNSRFAVQRELAEWKRPAAPTGGDYPRRAGVSAFGAGGTNVHLILEEYADPDRRASESGEAPQIVVLSAKNRDRLLTRVESLHRYLAAVWQPAGRADCDPAVEPALVAMVARLCGLADGQVDPGDSLAEIGMDPLLIDGLQRLVAERWPDARTVQLSAESTLSSVAVDITRAAAAPSGDAGPSLSEVAYTLQVGREAMECRTAFLAGSKQELLAVLRGITETGTLPGERDGQTAGQSISEEAAEQQVDACLRDARWDELLGLWLHNHRVDWKKLHRGRRPRRISLPAYDFAPESHWVPDLRQLSAATGDPQSPATPVAQLVQAASAAQAVPAGLVWRKSVSATDFFIRDHVVGGARIMPGAGFLHLVCEAAAALGLGPVRRLSDIVWVRPLTVGAAAVDLEIQFLPQRDGHGFTIGLSGRPAEAFVQGWLVSGPAVTPGGTLEPVRIAGMRDKASRIMRHDEIYQLLKSIGFDYGPSFQVTQTLHGSVDECLAELTLPDAQLPACTLHPSLLDAAFRASVGIDQSGQGPLPGIPVPFLIEEIRIFRPLDRDCHVHAACVAQEGLERKFDIMVQGLDGQPILEIRRFSVRLLKPASSGRPDESVLAFFQPRWQDQMLDPSEPKRRDPRVVVLFDRQASLAPPLAESLGRRCPEARLVRVVGGKQFSRLGDGGFIIDPESASDYGRVLAELAGGGLAVDAVVSLWSADFRPDPESKKQHNFKALRSLFHLYQALQRQLPERTVTVLPASFRAAGQAVAPHDAALYGFANSVSTINFRHALGSLEIEDTLADAELADALVAELIHGEIQGGGAVRLAPGLRQVRTYERFAPMPGPAGALRTGGVYLLTGGLGGIGRIVADHLARSWRPTIVLAGRSQPGSQGDEFMDGLRKLGARVSYRSCDIREKSQVKELLAGIQEDHGPLTGIFHAAGVESQILVTDLSWKKFEEGSDAKVLGLLNLEKAAAKRPPEFLCLFSSVAAAFGDFGACSYASANAFLDGYAQAAAAGGRHSARRIVSINWPFWQAGGFKLPEEAAKLYFQFSGMRSLDTPNALRALEILLGGTVPQAIVGFGDEPKMQERFRKIGARGMAAKANEPRPQAEATGRAPAAPADRTAIADTLKAMLFELIGVPPEKIDERVSIMDYGVDSVTMMDFGSRLNQRFGELPRTVLFDHQTVGALSDFILAQAGAAGSPASDTPVEAARPEAGSDRAETEELEAVKGWRHRMTTLGPGMAFESLSAGVGEDILLIPGIGFTGEVWERQFEALADRYRLTSIHLPGHGKSLAAQDTGLDAMCQGVMDCARNLGITGPFHLVATSLGGMVAQRMAYLFPARIKSLTLAVSFAELPPSFRIIKLDDMIQQELAAIRANDPDRPFTPGEQSAFRETLQNSYAMNPDFVKFYGKLVATESNAELLPRIDVNTLIIQADADSVVTPAASDLFHKYLPKSEKHVIRGAGHFVYASHAGEFNRLLIDFIDRQTNAHIAN